MSDESDTGSLTSEAEDEDTFEDVQEAPGVETSSAGFLNVEQRQQVLDENVQQLLRRLQELPGDDGAPEPASVPAYAGECRTSSDNPVQHLQDDIPEGVLHEPPAGVMTEPSIGCPKGATTPRTLLRQLDDPENFLEEGVPEGATTPRTLLRQLDELPEHSSRESIPDGATTPRTLLRKLNDFPEHGMGDDIRDGATTPRTLLRQLKELPDGLFDNLPGSGAKKPVQSASSAQESQPGTPKFKPDLHGDLSSGKRTIASPADSAANSQDPSFLRRPGDSFAERVLSAQATFDGHDCGKALGGPGDGSLSPRYGPGGPNPSADTIRLADPASASRAPPPLPRSPGNNGGLIANNGAGPWQGWRLHTSQYGQLFYHNARFNVSQCEMPPELADVLGEWMPAQDAEGNTYWWNTLHGTSSWTNPNQIESVFQAAALSDVAFLQLFVYAGGYLNNLDAHGCTALHHACSNRAVDAVSFLVESGATVDMPDSQGATPLHWACSHGCSEVVPILLKAGADPERQCNLGDTPMHLAAATNTIDALKYLLQSRTRTTIRGHGGRTPLEAATFSGAREAAQLLSQAEGAMRHQHMPRPPPQSLCSGSSVHEAQGGMPLSPSSSSKRIGDDSLSPSAVVLLMRLAADGARRLAGRVGLAGVLPDGESSRGIACRERGGGVPVLDDDGRRWLELAHALSSRLQAVADGSRPRGLPAIPAALARALARVAAFGDRGQLRDHEAAPNAPQV